MARSTKNHDRAPDKMAFSVALERSLVTEISYHAKAEGRTRNSQIAWMLKEAILFRKKKQSSATTV